MPPRMPIYKAVFIIAQFCFYLRSKISRFFFRAMSSKRKSPPTKLEGGCQPTTTTTTTAHINLATFNQKSSNLDKDTTLIRHSDSEHFTKQDTDCDIGDELTSDIDNNDHNNNDDDANDHCDSVNANTLSTDGFDGKTK